MLIAIYLIILSLSIALLGIFIMQNSPTNNDDNDVIGYVGLSFFGLAYLIVVWSIIIAYPLIANSFPFSSEAVDEEPTLEELLDKYAPLE